MIDDGQLWKVVDNSARARARVEHATQEGTVKFALEEPRDHGHFHRNNIEPKLLDKITNPKMNQSIVKVIIDYRTCKGFGTKHLHSLFKPITKRHPFELMVADTVVVKRKELYQKIGLWMDVYAQQLWVTKLSPQQQGKHRRRATEISVTFSRHPKR